MEGRGHIARGPSAWIESATVALEVEEMTMQTRRLEPQDFVAARLYQSEDDVVQEALRHLLDDRPDLRIALAAHQYATDTSMTLATAAALADISLERMKDELYAPGRGTAPRPRDGR